MNNAVVEKIRKLLALAEGSSNEHEAALAAQRAQELMLKHHVEEARVRGATKDSEPVGQEAIVYARPIPRWHVRLIAGICRNLCCDTYFTAGHAIYIVGREGDRQTVKYLFDYLRAEIQRLADCGWNKPGTHASLSNAKTWKRGFCLGAVIGVRNRLYATHGPAPTRTTASLNAAPITETALVLRDRVADAEAWTKANVPNLHKAASAPTPLDGYYEGRAAGRGLNLSGGKGITSGARRLTQARP